MTLPTGTISLSQVNVELSLSATALISLNDTAVRNLAGVASGQISMSNLQGKTQGFAFTISANQTNANLRTLAVAAGWNQVLPVVATINTGVVISGSVVANSTAALTIDGTWAGGVTLINNGTIAGIGGTGGAGQNNSPVATAGGRAVLVSSAVSIDNTSGIIAGGGGGGGGGNYTGGSYDWVTATSNGTSSISAGGGGGGGGQGGNVASTGGAKGSNASHSGLDSSGSLTNPTAGGSGDVTGPGNGGTAGRANAGSSYFSGTSSASGTAGGRGGGWGSAGINGSSGTVGGSAGQCLSGNSLVTWIATGTRYGVLV